MQTNGLLIIIILHLFPSITRGDGIAFTVEHGTCTAVPVPGVGVGVGKGELTAVCRKPGLRTARHPSQEKDGGEGKGKATYLTLTS